MRTVASPEIELLLLCARLDIDAGRAQRIATLLRADIDGDALLALARRHGLIPLLHRNLSGMDTSGASADVLQELRAAAEVSRAHNLMLTAELLTALRILHAAGITIVPYKGPALAAYLSGDMTLRQFLDLDLLVHPRDMARARDALIDRGHVTMAPRSRARMAMIRLFYYEIPLISKLGKVIELNWRMGPWYCRFPQMPDAMWERLGRFEFAGLSVAWPAPEDLLLILCLHGSKHKWDTLKWLIDIAEILRAHPDIDLEQVLADARAGGAERMLALSLLLAHEVLEAPVPASLLETFRRMPAVEELTREVCDKLTHGSVRDADTFDTLDFIRRLSDRSDTRLACRLLPPVYALRYRLMPQLVAHLRARDA